MGAVQRSRLLAAMSEAACEYGAANVTVAQIVQCAGVSRRTFYEVFADCEDCLHATLEHALACAGERVIPAYRSGVSWSERIRAALAELLGFLEDEPLLGRLLLVESLAAGPRVLERRASVIAQLLQVLEEGRGEAGPRATLTSLTAEAAIGGAISIVGARMSDKSGEPLSKLLNPLMAMIVLPYLGTAAARREMSRSLPARPQATGGGLDPAGELPRRITYRTMRVLTAISERPGRTNRAVAEAAGITDQGQISKLLARLQEAGLIENSTVDAARGQANSWKLTEQGRRLHGILFPRLAPSDRE